MTVEKIHNASASQLFFSAVKNAWKKQLKGKKIHVGSWF
jgi:hypothetical protein